MMPLDVVHPAPRAVPGDRHAGVLEDPSECRADEPAALVCVGLYQRSFLLRRATGAPVLLDVEDLGPKA